MSYPVAASLFLLIAAAVLAVVSIAAPAMATMALISGFGAVTFAVLSLREE